MPSKNNDNKQTNDGNFHFIASSLSVTQRVSKYYHHHLTYTGILFTPTTPRSGSTFRHWW